MFFLAKRVDSVGHRSQKEEADICVVGSVDSVFMQPPSANFRMRLLAVIVMKQVNDHIQNICRYTSLNNVLNARAAECTSLSSTKSEPICFYFLSMQSLNHVQKEDNRAHVHDSDYLTAVSHRPCTCYGCIGDAGGGGKGRGGGDEEEIENQDCTRHSCYPAGPPCKKKKKPKKTNANLFVIM